MRHFLKLSLLFRYNFLCDYVCVSESKIIVDIYASVIACFFQANKRLFSSVMVVHSEREKNKKKIHGAGGI